MSSSLATLCSTGARRPTAGWTQQSRRGTKEMAMSFTMTSTSKRLFPATGCDPRLLPSRSATLLSSGVLRQVGGSVPGFCNLMRGVAAVISQSNVAPLFPGCVRSLRHWWRPRRQQQFSKSLQGHWKRRPCRLVKAADCVDGGSGVIQLLRRNSLKTRKFLLQSRIRR